MAIYPDTPVTPDTIFYGASTTKAFVAAGLSLLIDEGKDYSNLQWTTPISQLIRDDFLLADGYSTHHVTLEDAASHRTGLPRHDFSYKGGNQTVRDVVWSLRFHPLTKTAAHRSSNTVTSCISLSAMSLKHLLEAGWATSSQREYGNLST